MLDREMEAEGTEDENDEEEERTLPPVEGGPIEKGVAAAAAAAVAIIACGWDGYAAAVDAAGRMNASAGATGTATEGENAGHGPCG